MFMQLAYLWSFLRANQSTDDFADLAQGLVFKQSMDPTVHHRGDFIPLGRRKSAHGGGVVARCELRMANYANSYPYNGPLYSGLLTPGVRSSNVIMRFSSVLDPVVVGGPVPSFALKVRLDSISA
jgi:hypothetical protein